MTQRSQEPASTATATGSTAQASDDAQAGAFDAGAFETPEATLGVDSGDALADEIEQLLNEAAAPASAEQAHHSDPPRDETSGQLAPSTQSTQSNEPTQLNELNPASPPQARATGEPTAAGETGEGLSQSPQGQSNAEDDRACAANSDTSIGGQANASTRAQTDRSASSVPADQAGQAGASSTTNHAPVFAPTGEAESPQSTTSAAPAPSTPSAALTSSTNQGEAAAESSSQHAQPQPASDGKSQAEGEATSGAGLDLESTSQTKADQTPSASDAGQTAGPGLAQRLSSGLRQSCALVNLPTTHLSPEMRTILGYAALATFANAAILLLYALLS